eukprot:Tbor_TRINITY_DN5766_c2_g1::TRINITY_DN5766_c2_g1_i3::g.19729::m.19729
MAFSLGVDRIGDVVNAVKDAGNPFMRLVFNVTVDTDNHDIVIPYFKMENIKDAAFQSQTGCEAIHKAIFQRLDSNNPVVIRKTLEICRYLIIEGPPQFPRLLYTQSSGKIMNIANIKKHHPEVHIPKDSIEQGNIYLAEAVYKGITGDIKGMIQYGLAMRDEIKNRDLKMGGAGGLSAVTYKSDFRLHQEMQQKAFKKRREEERARMNRNVSCTIEKIHEAFDGTLPPHKLVETAVRCPKKKFSKEEIESFMEATIDTGKVIDVCTCLDNVLKDGKTTLQVRYKILILIEALISELPEALIHFEEHNLGIHRHLSIEQDDNPTKSALMQQLAKRCMDIVYRKIDVPATTVVTHDRDEWNTTPPPQEDIISITPPHPSITPPQPSIVNPNTSQWSQQPISQSIAHSRRPDDSNNNNNNNNKWDYNPQSQPTNQAGISLQPADTSAAVDAQAMALQLQQQMSALMAAAGGGNTSQPTAIPLSAPQPRNEPTVAQSNASCIDDMFNTLLDSQPTGGGSGFGCVPNKLTPAGNEAMNGQGGSNKMSNASLPTFGNDTMGSLDQSRIVSNSFSHHSGITPLAISTPTNSRAAVGSGSVPPLQAPTTDVAASIQQQMMQMNDLICKSLETPDATPKGDHTPENTIMSQMQGFQSQMQQMMSVMMSLQQQHQSAQIAPQWAPAERGTGHVDPGVLLAQREKENAEAQQRQEQQRQKQEKEIKRVRLVALLKELQGQMFVTQNMLVQQQQQLEILKTQALEL